VSPPLPDVAGLPPAGVTRRGPIEGVLCDLLMGTMRSVDTWAAAAGDPRQGLRWRDAATRRMQAAGAYVPYLDLVRDAALEVGLGAAEIDRLGELWTSMSPWPDAAALRAVGVPYAFLTNCSTALADVAARQSRLSPQFVLSAEESGVYKPAPAIYLEGCRRLGTPRRNTAFIAGSAYDAKGGRDAGLVAWLVVRRPPQAPIAGVRLVDSLDAAVAAVRRELDT
jgi:2-haloacid dehalogenase